MGDSSHDPTFVALQSKADSEWYVLVSWQDGRVSQHVTGFQSEEAAQAWIVKEFARMAPHERDGLQRLSLAGFTEIRTWPASKRARRFGSKNGNVFDDHLFAPFLLRKFVVNCLSTSGNSFVSAVIGGFVTDRGVRRDSLVNDPPPLGRLELINIEIDIPVSHGKCSSFVSSIQEGERAGEAGEFTTPLGTGQSHPH